MSYTDYGYQSIEMADVHRYLLPALKTMLGKPSGAVLDLGCGNGAVARALLADGIDVYGVDASDTGIRLAKEQYPDRFYVHDLSTGITSN